MSAIPWARCEFCDGPLVLDVDPRDRRALLCMHCGRNPSADELARIRPRLKPGTLSCRHGKNHCGTCDIKELVALVNSLDDPDRPRSGRPTNRELERRATIEREARQRFERATV